MKTTLRQIIIDMYNNNAFQLTDSINDIVNCYYDDKIDYPVNDFIEALELYILEKTETKETENHIETIIKSFAECLKEAWQNVKRGIKNIQRKAMLLAWRIYKLQLA